MKYMSLREKLQLLQHLLQRDEQHQLAVHEVKQCLTVCVCVCSLGLGLGLGLQSFGAEGSERC